MTLAEMLPQRLSEWQPAGEGRHSLSLALDGGWNLNLTAERVDTLGCLVWELTLSRTTAAVNELPLATWAGNVARKAQGLLESLRVVEIDSSRREALLRSETPNLRGGFTSYHEVVLHEYDRASVRRFRVADGQSKREQVAFALTHDALVRCIESIAQN